MKAMTMTMETKTMAATCHCLPRCRSLVYCCLCPCYRCCHQCLQRHCGGTMSASIALWTCCLLPPPPPQPRCQHAATAAATTALSLPPPPPLLPSRYCNRCRQHAIAAATALPSLPPPLPHYQAGLRRQCANANAAATTTLFAVTAVTPPLPRRRHRANAAAALTPPLR